MQQDATPFPVSKRRALQASKRDPVLQQLFQCVRKGWTGAKCRQLSRYAPFRNEFTMADSLIYRGQRLVIPASLQTEVLQALHEGHPGAAAMKATARQCVWWLGIDSAIESMVRRCSSCCAVKTQPRSEWLPWPAETEPWSRVHIDFAGPFPSGQYALVMVDAHSKWPEVHIMTNITTAATIQRLRRTFSQEGIPRTIVSDNGPSLVSQEMERWLSAIGCRHVCTPPYHPKSNGLAERFVRTLKEHVRAAGEHMDLQTAVDRFLLTYRNTPHSTTGAPPAVLLKGHMLRTVVTALSSTGDKLWVKQHVPHRPKWEPALVVEPQGSRVVKVRLSDGTLQRCHVEDSKPRLVEDVQDTQDLVNGTSESHDRAADTPVGDGSVEAATTSVRTSNADGPSSRERPRRNIKPPERLGVTTYW